MLSRLCNTKKTEKKQKKVPVCFCQGMPKREPSGLAQDQDLSNV